MGSWIQFPKPVVKLKNLKPNVIWISHEHSDHLHLPTLDKLDKSTPVYFPDFPNKRINIQLKEIGYENLHPMKFGERYKIHDDIFLTCFEPNSLFNDSMVLIEVKEFKILNLNDAGLNPRIASIVGSVDVIASVFSPGASDYPWSWNHFQLDEKRNIMKGAAEGYLKFLKRAMKLHSAKYILPYAAHFAFWHPYHRRIMENFQQNNISDVVKSFQDTNHEVLDLLPGDSYNFEKNEYKRTYKERELFESKSFMLKHLEMNYDEEVFRTHFHDGYEVTSKMVDNYFEKLNSIPEIIFVEEIDLKFQVTNGLDYDDILIEKHFRFKNGKIVSIPSTLSKKNLVIKIPRAALYEIIVNNISWDEARIGNWCKFSRSPNVYNINFWRLLHAPYFRKNPKIHERPLKSSNLISIETNIAELLEAHGEIADLVLRRYGLYCMGCKYSPEETLRHAADKHAIGKIKLERLVKELNFIINSESYDENLLKLSEITSDIL